MGILPLLKPLLRMLSYQFFMRLHRIPIPPSPPIEGGDRGVKVPLLKGDLGGSRYMQLHIKLVSDRLHYSNSQQSTVNSEQSAVNS